MAGHYYVYMLTNWNNEVLYIGITNNLERRLLEHRSGSVAGFTQKYNLQKLVWFEMTHDVTAAIPREKQLKAWRRDKKNGLIAAMNPEWKDLSDGFKIPRLRSG
jgi:putative endonuclease